MVKISYEQKPYRKLLMETWGATVVPSPSNQTNAGRSILAAHPDSTGSLGIAISEAVEEAATREDTKYCPGQRVKPCPATPNHRRSRGDQAVGGVRGRSA